MSSRELVLPAALQQTTSVAKVSIGIPCYGDMKTQTALSLVSAVVMLKTTDCEIILNAQRGPYMHWNRDECLANAIREECTHLMFVDTDMVFPADGILRLLAAGKDIIGGNYWTKSSPSVSTVKVMGDNGELLDGPVELPSVPFECWAVATGFMLIDVRRVAEAGIFEPWFVAERPIGEDYYFCRLAADAGLEVWCDPTIQLQHLGDYAY